MKFRVVRSTHLGNNEMLPRLCWSNCVPLKLQLAADNVTSPVRPEPLYVSELHACRRHATIGACMGSSNMQVYKHANPRVQILAPRQGFLSTVANQAWPHFQVGRGSMRPDGAQLLTANDPACSMCSPTCLVRPMGCGPGLTTSNCPCGGISRLGFSLTCSALSTRVLRACPGS